MRGRPPIPTKILEARGSWRAKTRPREPQAPVAAPDPPGFLDAVARAEWRRLVPLLLEMRIISTLDRAALTVYCLAWSDFCDGKRRPGETATQQRLRRRGAADTILKVGQEFGLSPVSRTRVHVQAPPPFDPAEEFFGPKRN